MKPSFMFALLVTTVFLILCIMCGGQQEASLEGQIDLTTRKSDKLETDINKAMDELDKMESKPVDSKPAASKSNLVTRGILKAPAPNNETYENLGKHIVIARSIAAEKSSFNAALNTLTVKADVFDSATGDYLGEFTFSTPPDYPNDCIKALENVKDALILDPWLYTDLPGRQTVKSVDSVGTMNVHASAASGVSLEGTGTASKTTTNRSDQEAVTLPLVFLDPKVVSNHFKGSEKTLPKNECFQTNYLGVTM